MSYTSPNYSHKPNPHFRFSDEFKPPYTSPTNNGQSFSPYNYSSPKQSNRGGRSRYYNNSSPYNYNSSSPYNYNRNNSTYRKNNRSYEGPAPTSAYYNPSMLENPWEELEKEWKEKQELESNTKNAESSETSTK